MWRDVFTLPRDKINMEYPTNSGSMLREHPKLYERLATAWFTNRQMSPPESVGPIISNDSIDHPAFLIADNAISGCP